MTLNRFFSIALCVASLSLLAACSETQYAAHLAKQIHLPGDTPKSQGTFKVGSSYTIKGQRYYPKESYTLTETGIASWYGPGFHGKKTANGEIYNQNDLTAAHRTLQLPSIVRVTNLSNGRSLILRVNDRGPFAHNRILDVSERAASLLGFKNAGTARIKLQVLDNESRQVAAAAKTGQDTRGFEVALNRKPARKPLFNKPEPITEVALNTSEQTAPPRKPLPVQSEPLITASNSSVSGYVTNSNVSNLASGKIFVQAGSFSQEQNALNLSDRLSSYGPSKVYLTRVNNQPFFRVRLGPYEDRSEAKEILTALNESGNKNAVIVID